MLKKAILLGVAAAIVATPALAVTASEKQKTCAFGADNKKLKGAARSAFIKKCMADEGAGEKPAAAQ